MERGKIVSLEDRIPKLKQRRRKKANRRAIFLLSLFFILLILVLYLLSPLSNVKQITISGNRYLTNEVIISTSGITSSTSVWKLDKKGIKKRLEQLPEVKTASVQLVLPNSVEIAVKEYDRLAYLVQGSDFHPILSSGEVLTPLKGGTIPVHAPLLMGFKKGKKLESIVEVLDKLPEEITNAISEIHYDPSDSDGYRVRLFMNDGYEVIATSRTLADKLIHYPSIISQLDPKNKGVIDLEVGSVFIPYQKSASDKSDKEKGGQEKKGEAER
ncbi:cell division protein FtsQ/DivIB [Bacillus massiliigorillae]|uniref:cell division protein FtsQ/DivIB n=1 Tax=Bacillus massiliigorillae TaxID=1243664 RepID=UPI00039AC933|nr:FtsQ-type POTRA domain-containing protein [Bacillus massiliigorillae]